MHLELPTAQVRQLQLTPGLPHPQLLRAFVDHQPVHLETKNPMRIL